MSADSGKWTWRTIHERIRVGFGFRAWWFQPDIEAKMVAEGLSPSHYDGAVPLTEADKLLSSVDIVTGETFFTYIDKNGQRQSFRDETRIPVIDRNQDIAFYVARNDGPDQWASHKSVILDHILSWLGDSVQLGSVGLLENGAIAFASVQTPEMVTDDKTGIQFLPRLNALSVLNGTLRSKVFDSTTVTVCRNTVDIAQSEAKNVIGMKRTKDLSLSDIKSEMDALGLIDANQAATLAGLHKLAETPISDKQLQAFLTFQFGARPDTEGHKQTRWDNETEKVLALYKNDERAATWTGTALGLFQAQNTYEQHIALRRGAGDDEEAKGVIRAFRNMEDDVSGRTGQRDSITLKNIEKVLTLV